MTIGLHLRNNVALSNNFTSINFLEKMFAPIWKGTEQDLKIFRDNIIKGAYTNQKELIKSYNISTERIDDIEKEINLDVDSYLNTIMNNNNLVELKALVGSSMKELNERYMDDSLETNYPFADNAMNTAFHNKGAALVGGRAKVETSDLETISINTSNLSDVQKEELEKSLHNMQFQAMFSAVNVDTNMINIVYSRQGLNEYNQGYNKTKALNITHELTNPKNGKDNRISKDVNTRSLKLFESLASEYPTMIFNKKDKLGNVTKTFSSNEILGIENEVVAKELEKVQKMDEAIKAVSQEDKLEKRGSNAKETNLTNPVVQRPDPDNPNVEQKVKSIEKINLNEVLNLEELNTEESLDSMIQFDLKAREDELKKAKLLANDVSVRFIGYLEEGKSIEESKRLLKEFTNGNDDAIKYGMALAAKGFNELKTNNDILVDTNSQLTNAVEESKIQLVKATDIIKEKDIAIEEINKSFTEEIEKSTKEIKELGNANIELINENESLLDNKEELDKKIVKLDAIVRAKDVELLETTKTFTSINQKITKELDESNDQLKESNNKVDTLTKTLDTTKNDLEATKVSLGESIELTNTLNSEKTQLNSKVDTLTNTLNTTKNDLEATKVSLNESTESIKTLNNDLAETKSELTNNKTKVEQLSKSLDSSNVQLKESSSKIDSLNKSLESTQGDLNKANKNIDAYKAQLSGQMKIEHQYKEEIKKLKAELISRPLQTTQSVVKEVKQEPKQEVKPTSNIEESSGSGFKVILDDEPKVQSENKKEETKVETNVEMNPNTNDDSKKGESLNESFNSLQDTLGKLKGIEKNDDTNDNSNNDTSSSKKSKKF